MKLRQWVKDALGIIVLYSLLVIGVFLVNTRLENQQKSADVSEIQTAQNNNVN